MAKLFQMGAHGFIEHQLDAAEQFTGIRWPDDSENTDDGIIIVNDGFRYDAPINTGAPVDGMGLFDFWKFYPRQSARHLMVMQAQILVDAGVGWTLALTDGRAGGTPATTVDDPLRDISLATGTGPSVRTLNTIVAPKQYIRLTTAAPVGIADAFCRLFISSVPTGSIGTSTT